MPTIGAFIHALLSRVTLASAELSCFVCIVVYALMPFDDVHCVGPT